MAARAVVNCMGKSVSARSFADIPGPPCLPLLGSALMYRLGKFKKNQYHLALKDMYETYGPIAKEKIGNKTIVHVFDPEDIKTVYSVEGKYPVIPPLQETVQMYRKKNDLSLGLGNTNGEEWYILRANCIQKMLRPKEVAFHLPSVDETAREFVQRIEKTRNSRGEVRELRLEIGRWSLENAAKLVFDRKLGCLQEGSPREAWARQIIQANAEIFKLSGDLKLSLPFYKYIPTVKYQRLNKLEDFFTSEAVRLIDESLLRLKDAIEADTLTSDQFNFISYLLSRPELDLKGVTVICLSLFSDGLSTTTPTLFFNLYSLALVQNRNLQKRMFEEVQEHLPLDAPATPEAVSNLRLLKAFVKETFRIYPNGTEVSRYIQEDLVLSGYHVPAGTHVDLNPSVQFLDEDLFPEPNRHNPDRWLRDGSGQEIHPFLLTPFGHGTRMCAGRRFAEQDLYVVLARIIASFELEVAVGTEIGQTYQTLLIPDRPVRIKFKSREQ